MSDGVQIQTDQVSDFGKGLRQDADGGFASAAGRGADLHRQGVALGSQINAGPIMEVKQKYAEALANTDANLRVYPVAAGILADVAEEIAHRFAHADSVVHDAIRKALAANIVVVAASGNRGEAVGSYPGKYPEVLTVGAYGHDGKVADFSIAGPQVDLVAPGVDIVTPANDSSGYFKSQGTSEATALVSGAAALLRAKYPQSSAAEIVHRLTATATDAGPKGRDDSYGYGRLDIIKALTADVAPLSPNSAKASAASGAAPAAESSELPTAKSPVLLVGIVGGLVVLVGLVVVAVLMGRRRS